MPSYAQYYTQGELCKILGVNRSTLWRWWKDHLKNDFPKPIVIGTIRRYDKKQVHDYLKNKKRESECHYDPEKAQLPYEN